MTIEAKVIEHSVSDQGIELITMQGRNLRMVHAEFMTHRVFSRNASSSRAIPVKKIIEDIELDPAMPVFWGSNRPGMQAGEELAGNDLDNVKHVWLDTMQYAITSAVIMVEAGLHKQIANRILEPWSHINLVYSATDWTNFFELRDHKDAQPEMKAFAVATLEAIKKSTPKLLKPGEWHLPYILPEDHEAAKNYLTLNGFIRPVPIPDEINEVLKRVSTARCARVSYNLHDGRKSTVEEDLALFEKLLISKPLHSSPAEHQATPDTQSYYQVTRIENEKEELISSGMNWDHPAWHGNFKGWCQHRRMIPGGIV